MSGPGGFPRRAPRVPERRKGLVRLSGPRRQGRASGVARGTWDSSRARPLTSGRGVSEDEAGETARHVEVRRSRAKRRRQRQKARRTPASDPGGVAPALLSRRRRMAGGKRRPGYGQAAAPSRPFRRRARPRISRDADGNSGGPRAAGDAPRLAAVVGVHDAGHIEASTRIHDEFVVREGFVGRGEKSSTHSSRKTSSPSPRSRVRGGSAVDSNRITKDSAVAANRTRVETDTDTSDAGAPSTPASVQNGRAATSSGEVTRATEMTGRASFRTIRTPCPSGVRGAASRTPEGHGVRMVLK